MATIKPFKGVRPPKQYVEEVESRPYDVLDSEEARIEAGNNEKSLYHIIKPEIDFEPGTSEYDPRVYERAAENFKKFQEKGWLVQDDKEQYYIYAQTMNGKTQYGLVVCAFVEDYLNGVIKKHELTRRDKEEDRIDAMQRHLEFFNITMYFAPFVGGVVASMEERVAKGEMAPEAINQVKAALMGPLSGIGDSLFLGTLRVIAAAVGISLAVNGNPFGPIAFLLIYNIPTFLTRIIGAHKGYELGVSFLTKAQESGLMDKVIYARGVKDENYRKFLVIDATTGQNGVSQATLFNEAVKLDGIILTKYDSAAKGGALVQIGRMLSLPVVFVCVGEGYDDIRRTRSSSAGLRSAPRAGASSRR